ncbi:MAG: hypothetical protein PHG05_00035 [Candidatus Nanoarchaeia archaeon]|nr:hypothetical protein [Candidatus Nanoarchaeia archaeon]
MPKHQIVFFGPRIIFEEVLKKIPRELKKEAKIILIDSRKKAEKLAEKHIKDALRKMGVLRKILVSMTSMKRLYKLSPLERQFSIRKDRWDLIIFILERKPQKVLKIPFGTQYVIGSEAEALDLYVYYMNFIVTVVEDRLHLEYKGEDLSKEAKKMNIQYTWTVESSNELNPNENEFKKLCDTIAKDIEKVLEEVRTFKK